MNKPKMSIGSPSASCPQRSFSQVTKTDSVAAIAIKATTPVASKVPAASGTIDVLKMAEDAAKMQAYIASGGKSGKASGGKLIKPSGLFDHRVG